jgi:hypothetical protein
VVVLQVLMAVFIFCISRKFHAGWGIPGTEVPEDPITRKAAIGRGWEWYVDAAAMAVVEIVD